MKILETSMLLYQYLYYTMLSRGATRDAAFDYTG